MNDNYYRLRLQEVLYMPEYILAKIFRKDGPPLGVQFDSIPSQVPRKSHREENWHARKSRKFSVDTMVDCESNLENISPQRHGIGKGPMTGNHSTTKKHGRGKGLMTQRAYPGKKHGIGKGLMTVWRVVNSNKKGYSRRNNFSEDAIQNKKKNVQLQQSILRKLRNKEQTKTTTSLRSRKLECRNVEKRKQPRNEKCGLALEDVKCVDNSQFAMLLDDEELELEELREEANPPSCAAHFPTSGSHGCSLCKDLLAKFPPSSVSMKLPLCIQPWASSPELVTKLFKAFHFLYTYAATIGINSFTLDEFVEAFHDKDSLLIGQVHQALLKLLLSDIEEEFTYGPSSHAKKNCKFLHLLQSLQHHRFFLEFWQKSLNLLTWAEILRQLFVAAGFNSKLGLTPKRDVNKEVNLMEKYGLSPGTLKGELFSILLTKGNSGMKIPELAKSSSIIELNLNGTIHDLENLITSTLSGDITLFERISSSGYRLRNLLAAKECEDCSSDSEDFGVVDDTTEVVGWRDIENCSEHESEYPRPFKYLPDVNKNKTNILTLYNEIDESHPGELWFLGLMEGEYSDLSIEEKLNTLAGLIDLLRIGSSIRMEDPLTSSAECSSNINHYGSGAKIKRSMTKQSNDIWLTGICGWHESSSLQRNTSDQYVDSLVPISRISSDAKKFSKNVEGETYVHPMQSIFLGSDRRYNRYWLLLGPCEEFDPGHRRIYFESSEDGHWEMIDSREGLRTLMSVLDRRGVREARLLASLEKREELLYQAMTSLKDQSEINTSREMSSSPVSDVDNQLSLIENQNNLTFSSYAAVIETRKKGEHHIAKYCRSQSFDACIWKSFYFELNAVKNGKKAYLHSLRRCDLCHDLYWRDEKHCRICHMTFELDFDLEERYAVHNVVCRANYDVNGCKRHRILSSQLQALKAAIYAIESVVPEDALLVSWKRSAHNLWVNRLRRASSLTELLQVLDDFVTAVNEEWFYQKNNISGSYCLLTELFSNFSKMPQTYSAVALWLVKLDIVVSYHVESPHSTTKSKIADRLEDPTSGRQQNRKQGCGLEDDESVPS